MRGCDCGHIIRIPPHVAAHTTTAVAHFLVMHSYGGCPGSAAAGGLSKAARTAAGKQGGIIGLIFMCGFIAHEGVFAEDIAW